MKKRLFVFALAIILIWIPACGKKIETPNVLFIIIDTLRADHLSCYGYERNTSPTIDSLAATGVRWENCQAQAPWTLPATTSIFSGLSAAHHGAGRRPGISYDYGPHPEMPIMPVLFKEAGYRTCGIFNVVLLNEAYGFDKGFDHYSCEADGGGRAALIVDEFLEWVYPGKVETPFFAVLHFFDVHSPYNPVRPFNDMYLPGDTLTETKWEISEENELVHPEHLEHFIAKYDGEIAWVDSELFRLFECIRKWELDSNTVIVIVADHGEEFLDHGWIGHGDQLYQELLHVPLIMTGPGIPSGEVRDENVAQFDILPTLLSLCRIDDSTSFDGIDLLSDSGIGAERTIPSSNTSFNTVNTSIHFVSILCDNSKYIVVQNEGTLIYSMFDLDSDPNEMTPIPVDSLSMELLDEYIVTPRIWDPPEVYLDNETIMELQNLGYI